MAIDPTRVRRYAHGSRVPGWDDSVDLTKDPAVVPDPATTVVPSHVREGIETLMAKYPDVRSVAGTGVVAASGISAGSRSRSTASSQPGTREPCP